MPKSDPPRWVLRVPSSAVTGWPDDVEGYELLATTDDGETHAGEVLSDVAVGCQRTLQFPRDDGGMQWPAHALGATP